MGPIMVKIVIAVIALAIGALIGYIYRKNVGEKQSAVRNRRREI